MEPSKSSLFGTLKTYYTDHKDFLPLFVLIPTVIGGIWQTLELMLIGFSTLRFFSVSQLVSDGIIILCFTVIFYIFYMIVLRNLNPRKIFISYVENQDPFIGLYGSLAMFILVVFYIIVYVVPDIPSEDFRTLPINVSLALIFSYIFLFLMFLGSLIMLVVQLVKKYYFKSITTLEQLDDKQKKIEGYLKKKDAFWSTFYAFISILILAVVHISIFAVLIYIHSLRNQVVLAKDIENFRYLESNKHLSSELQNKYDTCELAYWNDKYIFLKLSSEKLVNNDYKILILKTEDVLFPK
ncbi:hypothetical protein [Kaistella faecalis]|nr:hypothetical protein [Chryseobacterium faecale]UFK97555.1 hypothetical protein LL667_11395 [Chryseobacterium faecale]